MDNVNIGFMCSHHGKERRDAWQKENKKFIITPGMWIKKEFADGEQVEHMWVKITEVEAQNNFVGVLDNDPVTLNNIAYGDVVNVTRDEVEQVVS